MSRTTIKVIAGFIAVFIILGGIKGFQIYQAIKHGQFTPPPEAITTAVAQKEEWQDIFHAVGSIQSVNGALLSTQAAGTVTKVLFEPGSTVEAGAILVELDNSVETADLKGAVALQARLKKSLERVQALKAKNAISSDEFDTVSAEYDRAAAGVESLKASITRKRITAPVSGKVGTKTVNVGDYVLAGKPIVSVHDLSKVYVNFSVPQKFITEVAPGAKVQLTTDSVDGQNFEGTVMAADPDISMETRTLKVQALIPNGKELLRPGMFVSVSLQLNGKSSNVIVPVSSINSAPYGDSVYIVTSEGDKKTVQQQFVKVGAKRGDFVQVMTGINEGAEVVTSGLFKLRPGAAVLIKNESAPEVSKQPTPADT